MVKSVYRYRDKCLLAILKNDGVIFARNALREFIVSFIAILRYKSPLFVFSSLIFPKLNRIFYAIRFVSIYFCISSGMPSVPKTTPRSLSLSQAA